MAGEVDTPMTQGQTRPPLGAAAMAAAKAAWAARASGGAPGIPGAPSGAPTMAPPQAPDAFSRPYRLPSRGVYYQDEAPGWDGTILIAPTRGQQEELLAGTADQPETKLEVLRQLMRTLIRWGPLPMERITIPDWTAAALHFLAMCAGSDEMKLRPVHQVVGCQKPTPITLHLTELPCITLRVADPGEDAAPAPQDEDPDLAILRAMAAEEKAKTEPGGVEERVLAQDAVAEPQRGRIVGRMLDGSLVYPDGLAVFWRHLRVEDLLVAEEFVKRSAEKGRAPGDPDKKGSPLHTFLLARHLVGVGEKQVSQLEALTWVRAQPSPVLDELRDAIGAHAYGYETTPRFQCGHCPGTFRMRLPLDGGLFRSRRARTADEGGRAIGA